MPEPNTAKNLCDAVYYKSASASMENVKTYRKPQCYITVNLLPSMPQIKK